MQKIRFNLFTLTMREHDDPNFTQVRTLGEPPVDAVVANERNDGSLPLRHRARCIGTPALLAAPVILSFDAIRCCYRMFTRHLTVFLIQTGNGTSAVLYR